MKRFFLAAALAAAALFTIPSASAQITLRSTTLAAAVAKTDRIIQVASASGVEVGDLAFVDRETMKVLEINGAYLTVSRGAEGIVAAHASGATIYVDDKTYFDTKDRSGTCTATAEKVLPVVNKVNGYVWQCTSSTWVLARVNGSAVTGTGPLFRTLTVSTVSTATAVTLTAAQCLGGMILEDPAGGGVTATMPTAALLVAAVNTAAGVTGAAVGDSFEFTIRNTADGNETITVAAGSGGTASGTMTIAQNNSKRFLVRLDNVTASSEAYTVYSLGTVTH